MKKTNSLPGLLPVTVNLLSGPCYPIKLFPIHQFALVYSVSFCFLQNILKNVLLIRSYSLTGNLFQDFDKTQINAAGKYQ